MLAITVVRQRRMLSSLQGWSGQDLQAKSAKVARSKSVEYVRGSNHPRTRVVDLARARVDGLEQLVDLLVRHLLAQVGEDVLELADADEARHVLVKDLEAAAVLLGLAGVAEAARPVEEALEGLEVDCRRAKELALWSVHTWPP